MTDMTQTATNGSETPSRGSQQVKRAIRRLGPIRLLISTIILLLAMVAWGLLIGGKIQPEQVISRSMEPTIQKGDRLFVVADEENEQEIERGNVVKVAPQAGDGYPLLKRVVALQGDTVYIVHNEVFVNKKPSVDEIKARGIESAKYLWKYSLKEDEYLVIGDNRQKSFDSLHFGPVHRDEILGKAVFRYSPLARLGFIGQEMPESDTHTTND